MTIEDQGISSHHCRLTIEQEEFFLEDLGTTNGTWINYDRIDRVKLQSGDRIRIGQRTVLKFSLQDEDEETYQRTLYEAAVRDPLTGAYNKRYFHERLGSELAYALRHGAPLSLLMFDLDHFKAINDEFGHPAGDYVLQLLASTIRGSIRTEDVFARVGGEEFAVIGRGLKVKQAYEFAERLRLLVESTTFEDNGTGISVTISIGTATARPPLPMTTNDLIKQADDNLYVAKRNGRNRVEPAPAAASGGSAAGDGH